MIGIPTFCRNESTSAGVQSLYFKLALLLLPISYIFVLAVERCHHSSQVFISS